DLVEPPGALAAHTRAPREPVVAAVAPPVVDPAQLERHLELELALRRAAAAQADAIATEVRDRRRLAVPQSLEVERLNDFGVVVPAQVDDEAAVALEGVHVVEDEERLRLIGAHVPAV